MTVSTGQKIFDRCTPLAQAGHKVMLTPSYQLLDKVPEHRPTPTCPRPSWSTSSPPPRRTP